MNAHPHKSESVNDRLGRPLRDLRISVTDRCNFRCPYCMPLEVYGVRHVFRPQSELMDAGELVTIASAFVDLGVHKIRITGGEPLLRPDLPEIVRGLRGLLGQSGDLALTTNGWHLEKLAGSLADAGLARVNVSLDSLNPQVAGRMNGLGLPVERILRGIDAAAGAGLRVKLNCLVQRGVNEDGLIDLCTYARERGFTLRFIEFMDVGNTNGWQPELVVPAAEIVAQVSARWALEPLAPAYRGEVAARYRYADGAGEIGIISSVTEPFCRDCHRARLSADGRLYTCLFASSGADLLGPLRSGADAPALRSRLAALWGARTDRYSEERAELLARHEQRTKVEMSYIGG
ncbi:cyclic pyranopterin monophosphate synthase [mine drainage metagenome]|uniref:GTP 3',8-cyclase n=1 Tax=mine drainage metagenome TaxID=410659 RepID=A0A1J5S0Q2_9ZZZZ